MLVDAGRVALAGRVVLAGRVALAGRAVLFVPAVFVGRDTLVGLLEVEAGRDTLLFEPLFPRFSAP